MRRTKDVSSGVKGKLCIGYIPLANNVRRR